ncbi:hypothetical protein XarbCFBP8130_18265 [Xanthomonas arboricola]|nr:hypothetical protein XarbCFBP8130_18265 [Xanthomonas arboricola]PPT67579.1 hypothetical protein XarbCFBP8150_16135 [Xanthomonas arboricola]
MVGIRIKKCRRKPAFFWNRESGIGNRESGIGNRESGIGNRESGIGCVAFALPIPHSRFPIPSPQSIRLIVKLPYTGVSRWVSNSRVRW